ncbi:MAG: hypothetical protein AB8B56_10200 [Crocinitomicaceae bacterium]
MKNKKIVCFGNSVGIRIRPNDGEGENYMDLLRKDESFFVENFCFSGNMIGAVSRNTDKILQKQADVIILQYGVVELSSRSTSRRMYDYLHYKTKMTRSGKFVQTIGLFLESKLRKPLVLLRFKRSWYHPERFIFELNQTISSLTKDSSATIICLGINTPSDRVEKHLPGTKKRIAQVHAKMSAICDEFDQSHFVGVHDLDPAFVPDGIHYNFEGHSEIHKRILEIIS